MTPRRTLRNRLWVLLNAPKTIFYFWKFYRMAGEDRPVRLALRWTWKTL